MAGEGAGEQGLKVDRTGGRASWICLAVGLFWMLIFRVLARGNGQSTRAAPEGRRSA